MPAKKSQFLSSFGKAFQIFKTITDAIMDQGGSDEDIARILTDRDLVKDLASRIMLAKESASKSRTVLEETVARVRQEKEEAEAPAKKLSSRIALAAREFLTFTHSKEGQKVRELLELTGKAITVVEEIIPRTERSYAIRKYYRIYAGGLDVVSVSQNDSRAHDLTLACPPSDPERIDCSFDDPTATVDLIIAFCKDGYAENPLNKRAPEGFVSHIRKEIEKFVSTINLTTVDLTVRQ